MQRRRTGGIGRFVAEPGIWAALLLALAALVACRFFGPRLGRWWTGWRQHPAAVEKAAFRALERACRSGDAVSAYRALAAWRSRGAAPACLEAAEAATLIEHLQRAVFGRAADWTSAQGRALAAALGRARRQVSPRSRRRKTALPPLNPAAITSRGTKPWR